MSAVALCYVGFRLPVFLDCCAVHLHPSVKRVAPLPPDEVLLQLKSVLDTGELLFYNYGIGQLLLPLLQSSCHCSGRGFYSGGKIK